MNCVNKKEQQNCVQVGTMRLCAKMQPTSRNKRDKKRFSIFPLRQKLFHRQKSHGWARLVNTTECKVVGTTEDDLVYFNLINIEAVPDMLSVYSGEFFRMFQPIHRVASTATASLPLLMN